MNFAAMIHTRCKRLPTDAEMGKWFNVQPSRAANVIPLAAIATK